MIKAVLKFGFILLVIALATMLCQGCTKQGIIHEDIQSKAKVEPPVKHSDADQVQVDDDQGELAKVGGRVSEEGIDNKSRISSLKDYFVVTTTDGDFIFYDIRFDFDKYNLRPEARESLTSYAKWLIANKKYFITIEGHCDEVGTEEYNLALGERRADAVARYLSALGVNESRIKTVSYGEEFPLDPAQTESAYAKNRRVHFIVPLEKQ